MTKKKYFIPNNIISIAHRGYSGKNTLKSFQKAIEKGFDIIELDIQLCKSGEIIVYHDLFLKKKEIANLTLDQIKKINSKIMTLNDFFTKVNYFLTTIYLDLKGDDKLAYRLYAFFKTYNIDTTGILVSSFNHNHLIQLHKLMPSLNLGFITSNQLSIISLSIIMENINYLIVHWDALNVNTINWCKSNNIKVFTYTMNNKTVLNYMLNFDVDGIISDWKLLKHTY